MFVAHRSGNGELICFTHVLLNALDIKEQTLDVKVVIEGTVSNMIATRSNSAEAVRRDIEG